ncbi:MAG TPA: response regulator transcription factor [Gemmatimonas sp.]|uniref:response regulator transcription factor n=1 Tax=Gemmatimonas sp. TaxID=1962908 RepID=UPI002EDA86DA
MVIEDHRLLREGLAAAIERQEGFAVLASAACAGVGLEAIREMQPRVVLLDAGLPEEESWALAVKILLVAPATRVIVTGLSAARNDVAAFVRSGVSGFIMKDASVSEFMETIRVVARGDQALPRALTGSLFSQIMRDEALGMPTTLTGGIHLTARERQIMDLLGAGLSNKEIAAGLHIAVHTVKSHVHNLLEKLSLHTRMEVAAYSHGPGRINTP